MLDAMSVLAGALLFGAMTFYSFGFAPVLFAQMPMEQVRPLLRGTFPYYYAAVIAMAALATALALPLDALSTGLLATILITTIYARQILMPQINAATDSDNQRAFKRLHGASVVLQLVQLGLAAWALLRLTI